MKLVIIFVSCCIAGYASAAADDLRYDSRQQSLRARRLTSRSPVPYPGGNRSKSPPPLVRAALTNQASVKLSGATGAGSTFIKTPQRKSEFASEHNRLGFKPVEYPGRVSAGGVNPPGGAKLAASATGRNVGVRLDIPEGSKGHIQSMIAGKEMSSTTHDHTHSPVKFNFPPDYKGSKMSVNVGMDGPGKVKAKAWN